MPRNARCVWPGLPYHVTQRGSNGQRVFFQASDFHIYLKLLQMNLADGPARVLAYCLMTNHVHLVVVPEREDSLAVLFRRVHGRYAQYLNARRQRSGHLWQNRFFSCPLASRHLWTALRYVERNPVRAGLAPRPGEYEWCSARAHLLGQDRSAVLDMEFWEREGRRERWEGLLATPDELVALRLLRRCTYAGRPYGDEEFVAEQEQRFHRRWWRWSFETEATSRTAASTPA